MPFISEDFVAIHRERQAGSWRATAFLGDQVEVIAETPGWTEVRLLDRWDVAGEITGFVRGRPELRDTGVLRLSMVDVQQGDGLILESPGGRIVFIDGGDNKLFARHAAARYRHRQTSDVQPLDVDAIVITHGDADHFSGLTDIRRSEDLPVAKASKRLFIRPHRVLTNGIIKAPTSVPERERLGRTVMQDGTRYIVGLHADPRQAPAGAANSEFTTWGETLDHWEQRGPIEFTRVHHGMAGDPFAFLAGEGIAMEVQGPFTDPVAVDGGTVEALPFLHAPTLAPEIAVEAGNPALGAESASHTINGRSIALRIRYGLVRISLTGDLNREAMQRMLTRLGATQLQAEVLKAPHHGSADFDHVALDATRATVGLVSSGDEDERHEHIHPRATLMAGLGIAMPGAHGIVMNTELAAFFAVRDLSSRRTELRRYFVDHAKDAWTRDELTRLFAGDPDPGDPRSFFAFERTNFGIIHVRTDGERLLVFSHSGKERMNEAYRMRVTLVNGDSRQVAFEPVETR